MAFTPVNIPPKQKGGGGLFGKLAGGIAGGLAAAALAPFTGGASLAAAVPMVLGGIGTGAGLGGAIGEAASPSEVKQPRPVSALETAAQASPGAQLALLNQGEEELRGSPMFSPQEKQEGSTYFSEGRRRLQSLLR